MATAGNRRPAGRRRALTVGSGLAGGQVARPGGQVARPGGQAVRPAGMQQAAGSQQVAGAQQQAGREPGREGCSRQQGPSRDAAGSRYPAEIGTSTNCVFLGFYPVSYVLATKTGFTQHENIDDG